MGLVSCSPTTGGPVENGIQPAPWSTLPKLPHWWLVGPGQAHTFLNHNNKDEEQMEVCQKGKKTKQVLIGSKGEGEDERHLGYVSIKSQERKLSHH